MKLNNIFLAAICILLIFTGCKRDSNFGDTDSQGTTNITDPSKLVVPASFNFETVKDLTVRVKVQNQSFPGERFRINIYIDIPTTGKLTIAGMTDENGEFTTPMRVATDVEYIYIEKVDARGSKVFEKVKVNQFVNTLFKDGAKPDAYLLRKSTSGLDCNSGCTQTYNNHTGTITINSGQVVCVTGTFNGKIIVNGSGILKMCASGVLDSLVINNSGRAIILEDAVLTVGYIVSNHSTTEFTNWSDSLVSNHCIAGNSIGENHGKFYVQCGLTLTNTAEFNNFGELYTAGSLTVHGILNNYYYTSINNNITVSASGKLNNYCNLTSKNNVTISGELLTNSYLKVMNLLTVNNGGKLNVENGSLVSTLNISNLGTISGSSGANIIKVSATSGLASGSVINGSIEFCDNNGIETNLGTFTSPAIQSCGGYIPQSTCNSEGFGTFVIADADNDGISDLLDDYPNDPKRAFNQFYPCATTCSNFAFEDLWPAQGDYDFNDHIVAYNLQKVFSPDQTIVDFQIKMKPRAIGAGFKNGIAFSLDQVTPGAVERVTGSLLTTSNPNIVLNSNGTEAGQTHAVIWVYDSPEPLLRRAGGAFFNTIQANPRGTSDTAYIKVTFQTAVANALIPFQEFNPFLVQRSGNGDRGIEIHLPNRKPTDKANVSKFGTGADRSIPSSGVYYKNANNLPWAMEIPENFVYPQEKKSILDTYYFFDDWAISGGTVYTNWFRNFGSYRNSRNVFVE